MVPLWFAYELAPYLTLYQYHRLRATSKELHRLPITQSLYFKEFENSVWFTRSGTKGETFNGRFKLIGPLSDYQLLYVAEIHCEDEFVRLYHPISASNMREVLKICFKFYMPRIMELIYEAGQSNRIFHVVCLNNHISLARKLLDKVTIKPIVLKNAISKGFDEIALMILGKTSQYDTQALSFACQSGSLTVVLFLLKNRSLSVPKHCLDTAALNGHCMIFYALLNESYDLSCVDLVDSFKGACVEGSLELVNYILDLKEYHAVQLSTEAIGQGIIRATKNDHLAIVALLLPLSSINDLDYCLAMAGKNGNIPITQELLNHCSKEGIESALKATKPKKYGFVPLQAISDHLERFEKELTLRRLVNSKHEIMETLKKKLGTLN